MTDLYAEEKRCIELVNTTVKGDCTSEHYSEGDCTSEHYSEGGLY